MNDFMGWVVYSAKGTILVLLFWYLLYVSIKVGTMGFYRGRARAHRYIDKE